MKRKHGIQNIYIGDKTYQGACYLVFQWYIKKYKFVNRFYTNIKRNEHNLMKYLRGTADIWGAFYHHVSEVHYNCIYYSERYFM